MLSVIFAGAVFGFYYMLVYKKAYDLFCINFKNSTQQLRGPFGV